MHILVVAATEFEIEPLLSAKVADILITGVGSVPTAYHLTKRLLCNKYDMVIQAGVAGTFSNEVDLEEVVLIKKDIFADVGVEEKEGFKTVFEMGYYDENQKPYKGGWLINESEILTFYDLKKVNAITVNKMIEDAAEIRKMNKKFPADIESMEGAAFHYVCLQQKISFVQLRAVSNKIGDRNKNNWKLREAIENLNVEVQKLIQSLER